MDIKKLLVGINVDFFWFFLLACFLSYTCWNCWFSKHLGADFNRNFLICRTVCSLGITICCHLIVFFVSRYDVWIRPVPPEPQKGLVVGRCELLKNLISVPFIGAFAYAVYRKMKWNSFEEKYLTGNPDAVSSATIRNDQSLRRKWNKAGFLG